ARRAGRRIVGRGRSALPGAVDPHAHMGRPMAPTVTCGDFASGTISAACGGTTTHIDFCVQRPGQTFHAALATWHEKIERAQPVIDVGFHQVVTDIEAPGRLEELSHLPEEGITSFKLFMAYKGANMVDDAPPF